MHGRLSTNAEKEPKTINGGRFMSWKAKWEGRIWVAEQSVQPNGTVFERVSRSPGSRLLFIRSGMILLSREKRKELSDRVDYRLPGGKVFDTNDEYQSFLASRADIIDASRKSACKEALEEVGLIVNPMKLSHFSTDVLGATCSWDLIYWICEDFKENEAGAQYHETESDEIMGADWIEIADACKLALDKTQFSESRSAVALLTYAQQNGYITIATTATPES